MNNTNTYSTKVPYSSPSKVLYPMEQKVKDIEKNVPKIFGKVEIVIGNYRMLFINM